MASFRISKLAFTSLFLKKFYFNGNAVMQNEGDLIVPALFSHFDGKEESVDKLFLDDGSSAVLEGLIESKSKIELISPEDLAWVDSCLVADPELSLENWVSLKEALLDSITNFADSFEENNAAGLDEAGKGEQMEVDEKEVVGQPETVIVKENTADVRVPVNHTEGDDHDDGNGEEIEKEIESPEIIFRVWNLQEEQEEEHELIPELTKAVADLQVVKEEDDQFLTELKQAVAESILKDKQRDVTDEASTVKDAKLDELISSMGDLSVRSPYE